MFTDRLECGDWVIPTDSIKAATLYQARQLLIPAQVLAVETAERTYQFGINPWCKIRDHLPFTFSRERIRLRMSPVSIIIRVALVTYLLYLVMS